MPSDPLSAPVDQLVTPDLLRLRAETFPDTSPINVDGSSITYAEWDRRSNAVAHGLVERGVRRGDRVVLYFAGMDWIDYAIGYFGVLKAGATASHLSPSLSPDELRRRLSHAAAAGLVHGVPVTPPVDFTGWTATVDALDGGDHAAVDVQVGVEDISDILYTSGTTGPAKPYTIPHGNVTFGRALATSTNFDGAAPVLAPMPLGSRESSGIVGIFALTTTSVVIVCRPDDPERAAELVQRHRVGSLMLTPLDAMAMVTARVHERYDLSSVTTVGVASAALPASLARALKDQMPQATIMTAYGGGSEAVPASVVNVYDPARPMCMGRPRPGTELQVRDEDREVVPTGEIGEIWLRTDAPKRLYLFPDRHEQVHVDGWTRTHDLGYTGPDGDLYLVDRDSDAIRVHGKIVSSLEVEGALYEHPAVRQAAVIGITDPDPGVGQAIIALVVLADNAAAVPDLRSFVAGQLAAHQVPEVVHVVAELPRGVGGKLLKHVLRQRYAGEGGTARLRHP